jgi:hypothetical protein
MLAPWASGSHVKPEECFFSWRENNLEPPLLREVWSHRQQEKQNMNEYILVIAGGLAFLGWTGLVWFSGVDSGRWLERRERRERWRRNTKFYRASGGSEWED